MSTIFHALTAILFLLKSLGVIGVSWWVVAAPSIIAITSYLLIFLLALIVIIANEK